jgi:alkanesulfonate monooxygenase SsuD/methylene tetrahydromethanopterin reductase-like flavin-dependent oxidoreductase (luciferase family)
MSDGRLDLGLGSGGAPIDRAFSGVADVSAGELVDRLGRGLGEFTSILRGEPLSVPPVATIAGRAAPPEVSVAFAGRIAVPPVLVGGQSRGTIDVAARYADRWNAFGPGRWGNDFEEAMTRANNYLDEQCVANGRRLLRCLVRSCPT